MVHDKARLPLGVLLSITDLVVDLELVEVADCVSGSTSLDESVSSKAMDLQSHVTFGGSLADMSAREGARLDIPFGCDKSQDLCIL